MLLQKISLPKRSTHCSSDKELFQPGMVTVTLLEKEDNQFVRIDFCEKCWNKRRSNNLEGDGIFWKSKFPSKKKYSDKLLTETLSGLNAYLEENSVDADIKAFFLALHLERKRKLILRGETEKSCNKVFIYECRENGELIFVPKIDFQALDPEKIKSFDSELGHLIC